MEAVTGWGVTVTACRSQGQEGQRQTRHVPRGPQAEKGQETSLKKLATVPHSPETLEKGPSKVPHKNNNFVSAGHGGTHL
jgi:hypothetical protein